MLVAPILDAAAGELLGVIQLINNKAGAAVRRARRRGHGRAVQDARHRASSSAQKLAVPKSKYDFLVADAVISAGELETRRAQRAQEGARHRERADRGVPASSRPRSAQALAKFFGVPYEPFKPDRIKPVGPAQEPQARVRRRATSGCPLEENPRACVVMCLDPERVAGLAHRRQRVPEGAHQVSTGHDAEGVQGDAGPVLRRRPADARRSIGDLLAGLDAEDDEATASATRRRLGGGRQRAGEAREQGHRRRLQPGRLRHPHRALPGQGARPRSASARTARSQPYIEVPATLPQRRSSRA